MVAGIYSGHTHAFQVTQPTLASSKSVREFHSAKSLFGINRIDKSMLSLKSSGKDDFDIPASWKVNPVASTAWLALVIFAFAFAPGDLNDNSLIEAVIADPVHPGINEAYYTLFNVFAPLPIILASLVLPQGSRRGLPAGPFVVASAFLGYFTLGLYLSLRPSPRTTADEISWVTRLLENKILSGGALALLVYLPFACGLLPEKVSDSETWTGLWDLLTTNRFACVSVVDLVLLHISAVSLIPKDYMLRIEENEDNDGVAWKVATLAAVFPFVGPALYCVLRPTLPVLKQSD